MHTGVATSLLHADWVRHGSSACMMHAGRLCLEVLQLTSPSSMCVVAFAG
jgi:hypothetical protein